MAKLLFDNIVKRGFVQDFDLEFKESKSECFDFRFPLIQLYIGCDVWINSEPEKILDLLGFKVLV